MSADRTELPDLVDQLPDDQVESVTHDLRSRLTKPVRSRRTMPPTTVVAEVGYDRRHSSVVRPCHVDALTPLPERL